MLQQHHDFFLINCIESLPKINLRKLIERETLIPPASDAFCRWIDAFFREFVNSLLFLAAGYNFFNLLRHSICMLHIAP